MWWSQWVMLELWLMGLTFPQPHVPSHELRISMRDAADQPLVGVTVIVRDELGTHDLGQAMTDGAGIALVPQIPVATVRVVVAGTLPSGTPIQLVGNDDAGILVFLTGGTLQLDLVSDENGIVILNPLTMTARDDAAIASTSSPMLDEPALRVNLPSPVILDIESPDHLLRTSATPWWGWLLLVTLLAMGFGMGLLMRPRSKR